MKQGVGVLPRISAKKRGNPEKPGPHPQENPTRSPINSKEPTNNGKDRSMDRIETETILKPDVETVGQDNECLIPITDYAQRLGLSRRTVDRYAKVGRIETKKQLGRIYVVDKPLKPAPVKTDNVRHDKTSEFAPLVQSDWFDFGMVQAQAKAKTKWQIACLTFAVLFAVVVITGSAGGVWLWTDRAAKANMLTAAQNQLTNAGEQFETLQDQLATERQDHITQLESLQTSYTATVGQLQETLTDRLAAERQDYTAQLDSQRASYTATAAQLQETLTDRLAAERQDYTTQLDSQRASYTATVGQLQERITELAGHVVELSKAVAEIQLTP